MELAYLPKEIVIVIAGYADRVSRAGINYSCRELVGKIQNYATRYQIPYKSYSYIIEQAIRDQTIDYCDLGTIYNSIPRDYKIADDVLNSQTVYLQMFARTGWVQNEFTNFRFTETDMLWRNPWLHPAYIAAKHGNNDIAIFLRLANTGSSQFPLTGLLRGHPKILRDFKILHANPSNCLPVHPYDIAMYHREVSRRGLPAVSKILDLHRIPRDCIFGLLVWCSPQQIIEITGSKYIPDAAWLYFLCRLRNNDPRDALSLGRMVNDEETWDHYRGSIIAEICGISDKNLSDKIIDILSRVISPAAANKISMSDLPTHLYQKICSTALGVDQVSRNISQYLADPAEYILARYDLQTIRQTFKRMVDAIWLGDHTAQVKYKSITRLVGTIGIKPANWIVTALVGLGCLGVETISKIEQDLCCPGQHIEEDKMRIISSVERNISTQQLISYISDALGSHTCKKIIG